MLASLSAPAFARAAEQQAGGDQPENENARARIQDEGEAALERMKRAVGKARAAKSTSPVLPARPDAAAQRRAFEGLKARRNDPDMAKRAQADIAAARERVAAERDAASRRVAQALGLEQPEQAALAGVVSPGTGKHWVPVLFVSSSMPIETLRTYAGQLERAGGVMAFRGMPGGMRQVAPMAKLSAAILRRDPGCEGPACAMRDVQLIVDPLVFRQHGVARVPALAMIPGDPTLPYCERDEASPRGAHLVQGDAALSGLLEEYDRLGGREEVRDALAHLARR
ncbi:type-F conjugative transfer system pilin assembly protein TrbC [Sphingobium sp. YR768]|uniref:type-F conjugative transfer system pilin assembly protein TrbC n=1 Tax=Sphingobium sp. YR768 TaxID=1884365 RepID=UPI0008C318DE|nr:type-F conjugative transfer system pilin assembly protein TrbC [Sphingobium sp. YR768]SES06947.1 type-F conjugative transfer system pilin assembly protein TrbC [Sphingobium sp. YR768]